MQSIQRQIQRLRPRHTSWLAMVSLSLVALCTLVLAACGSSSTKSSTTTGSTSPSATSTSGAVSATATSSSGSGGGGSGGSGGGGGSATPTPTPTLTTIHVPPSFFTVTATGSNSAGDSTVIDNVLTNNSPGLLLFVTPNWNPGGSGGVYDNHPLGVYYISGQSKWAIFHQDLAAYTPNASYNVYIGSPSTTEFVAKAPSSSSSFDYFEINNTTANGNPNALVFVTPNWNPNGATGVYDNHAIGVYYRPDGRWAIFHQDTTPYTPNAAYNVMVLTSDGTNHFVQHACSASCVGDWIGIGSSASNGRSNAVVIVTANWNPGGSGGVYDNHNVGVYYGSNQWRIFHQDTTAYTPNSAYNVVIFHS